MLHNVPMHRAIKKHSGIIKYIISGGTATCVNLGVLYALTEYAGVHYLQSAIISFICAFFFSFLLQKFWTFNNRRKDILHWQMAGFLAVALVNLSINTLLIYLLVEYAHVWYLLSAILAGGLIALSSFFIYRHLIFREHAVPTPTE
jgi:putative flippase GtrA